jgi:hypothetical protein
VIVATSTFSGHESSNGVAWSSIARRLAGEPAGTLIVRRGSAEDVPHMLG